MQPLKFVTKSDLMSLRQCPRRLWLELHEPLAPPERQDRRAKDGEAVNKVARELLGQVVWPLSGEDKQQAAAAARVQLEENSTLPFVEFPVFYNGLYVRIDALIPTPMGYIVRETKSAGFPTKADDSPGSPEDVHLDDVAIQAWAVQGAGIRLTKLELSLLNKSFVYRGDGNYVGLLRQMDVTSVASERIPLVQNWVSAALAMATDPMPAVTTGAQCNKPYPCPYIDRCKALEPPPPPDPVTLLPDAAGKALARKLIAEGFERLSEVPEAKLSGKDVALYRRIRAAHIREEPILEPDAGEYLRGLPYPRYWFDFEAIDLPVPIWAGTRPFQQVPFQWSCHIEDSPGSFRHAEFLDTSGADPSRACAESLLATLGDNASAPIVVYYKTYEDSRLRELAERFPDLCDALFSIRSRLVDLLPITRGSFYSPLMEGSFSIKKVLPAMSTLRYDTLAGVQDGEEAQVAYLDAAISTHTTDARRIAIRQQLLTYCRQDTWVLVLIAYYLMGLPAPQDDALTGAQIANSSPSQTLT